MGNAPHAILAYGYDLGVQIGERELDDVARQLIDARRTRQGEERTNYHRERNREMQRMLRLEVGLEFVKHGGTVDPSFILAAVSHDTDWEQAMAVDLNLVDDEVDELLRWAARVLKVDLEEKQPRWLLAAQLDA